MYDLITGQLEIPASEYWQMTPSEVGRRLEQNRSKYIGGLHEDDYHRLVARREELKSKGVNVL